MQQFSFTTYCSTNYQVGQIFVATENKREESIDIHIIGEVNDSADYMHNKFSENESIVAYLLRAVFYAEKVFEIKMKNGYNKITKDGDYGFMPTECRSKLFAHLRKAINNAIYKVVAINPIKVGSVTTFSVECEEVIISSIPLIKTNLGMSNKKYFAECEKAAKYNHPKNWCNMARVAMAQANTAQIIEAIKNGETDVFDGYMPVENWNVAEVENKESAVV